MARKPFMNPATINTILNTAPMIADCPLSMECRLLQILDFKMDEVFRNMKPGDFAAFQNMLPTIIGAGHDAHGFG